MSELELKAYALGYYHGRSEGVEKDPFVADDLRHLYRRGYDAGVADYAYTIDSNQTNGGNDE